MERQESGAPVFAPDSSPGEGSDRWRKAMEAADTNRPKIDFIETELDVAITFVKIARVCWLFCYEGICSPDGRG
jgi:hypothetical protein